MVYIKPSQSGQKIVYADEKVAMPASLRLWVVRARLVHEDITSFRVEVPVALHGDQEWSVEVVADTSAGELDVKPPASAPVNFDSVITVVVPRDFEQRMCVDAIPY